MTMMGEPHNSQSIKQQLAQLAEEGLARPQRANRTLPPQTMPDQAPFSNERARQAAPPSLRLEPARHVHHRGERKEQEERAAHVLHGALGHVAPQVGAAQHLPRSRGQRRAVEQGSTCC